MSETNKWIGYAVSVNCGEPLGCYQGTILEADGGSLTLTKAFRNGFPYPKSRVTLNAADIKELKIIEARPQHAEPLHSTVAVTKTSKKAHRATVCENLQANPSNSGNYQSGNQLSSSGSVSTGRGGGVRSAGPTRSKPIDIQTSRNNKNTNHTGSYGNTSSTPKGRAAVGHERARRRNEACFGSDAADPALASDFDFEGNLALFDKRALFEQLRQAHRPDLVRQADELGKLRHDENVLGGAAAAAAACLRAIQLPAPARAPLHYVTDEGGAVPAATSATRAALWAALRRYGVAESAVALLARAAADVALRLVGGGRRLEPRNAHQTPTAVALVGPHRAGSVGVAAARLLAAHGARASVLVGGAAAAATACAPLQRELTAFALGGTDAVSRLDQLPSPDIILLALYDLELDDSQEQYSEIIEWARSARAAIVAVEPPESGWEGLSARASVLGVLPAALSAALGRVYLANVAPPPRIFADLGIQYRPPFGAAAVLPLHPADSDD